MALRRVTLKATVTDTFKRFVDQISPASDSIVGEVVNGVFAIEDNASQWAFLTRGTSPATEPASQKWPAGSFRGEGPNVDPGSGVMLEEIWLKNTTAAAVSIVTFTGTIRTVD